MPYLGKLPRVSRSSTRPGVMQLWKRCLFLGVLLLGILPTANTPGIAYAGSNDLFARSSSSVAFFVSGMAKIYGVDEQIALWITKKESTYAWAGNRFNPRILGDDGNSRGLWQISKRWHPEVSDAVAFDIVSSTIWAMEHIRAGNTNEWTTYKFCRKWYGDCPF